MTKDEVIKMIEEHGIDGLTARIEGNTVIIEFTYNNEVLQTLEVDYDTDRVKRMIKNGHLGLEITMWTLMATYIPDSVNPLLEMCKPSGK